MLRTPMMGTRADDDGGVGIDSNMLLLMRATSSGIVDASLYGRTVTNSGCSVTSAGITPFGDSSRAIYDPTAAAMVYLQSAGLSVASAMGGWIKSNTLFKITSGASAWGRELVYGGYNANGAGVFVKSYPTTNTTPLYSIIPGIFTSEWIHIYVDFSSGIDLYVNGVSRGAENFSFSPGSSPVFALGRWASNVTTYSPGDGYYAEFAVWDTPPWTTDFTPPSAPFG